MQMTEHKALVDNKSTTSRQYYGKALILLQTGYY